VFQNWRQRNYFLSLASPRYVPCLARHLAVAAVPALAATVRGMGVVAQHRNWLDYAKAALALIVLLPEKFALAGMARAAAGNLGSMAGAQTPGASATTCNCRWSASR